MKFKAKIAVFLIFVIAAVYCAVTAFAYSGESPKSEGIDEAAVTEQGSISEEEFILKEYEGYIGIFSGANSKTPMAMTDIDVDTLRAIDRELLKDGVRVKGREEMAALLEDLGS
jgi:hypothetical protein